MTPADLKLWIDTRGGLRAASRDLDISRPRLKRMLAGTNRIPRHIALACAALNWELNMIEVETKAQGVWPSVTSATANRTKGSPPDQKGP